MKPKLILLTLIIGAATSPGASNVDPANPYAYGANIGWINAYANGANGAVVGEFVCRNYLYGANVGWIHLGNGAPTNGVRYTNAGANDYGVNHLGDGRLRGFAYGANIGWIHFEDTGNPRVDFRTGNLHGFVWSANCGWISLSNAVARVRILNLDPATDTDGDGMADAWERLFAGNLTTLGAGRDSDGDGVPDVDEYRADTNPLDPDDRLRIVAISTASAGNSSTLTWTSKPSRMYGIETRTDLLAGSWADVGLGPIPPDPGPTTLRGFAHSVTSNRFFRVRAFRPLSP
ncbi:MAG: thrombospondin type 3 repeat-containing protein [Verrucomicrobiae bacterium]|nr:thrombospondin type 3 repeat-containing protein [Verrucomicrobiae bacterium]MDW8344049.1 thrombospondin type 3 repeat-containing protein [Verrucomicrobiae bacterium]